MEEINLLPLIFLAVAMVALPAVAVRLYRRMLQVEILRYKCDFAFNRSVLHNEQLSKIHRELLQKKYLQQRPSYLVMFFSRKPLQIEQWYNGEQLDAFFL
ncbi:hypothetical protein RM549_06105 [Salegentibacter sp. F188]|uniref:Uncharacterized protein n=1 Tax=Autumnicola patrickiae TaxID=3075591 RepID=A0ABU3E0A4_9FLAO|nr:hypothetical protein [Salegentibacter sp. F188]MDT0689350.1 hypothetical protein [Salegentibacter sp. F188]